jgi:ribonuclease P protein component
VAAPDADARGLPREARLRHATAYRRVFDAPEKSVDPCFVILAKTSDTGHARLGLALSKRNLRRAVDRNRIKRLVRESFRLSRSRLPSVDLVVLGRSGLTRRSNREILRSLDRHWDRISANLSLRSPD